MFVNQQDNQSAVAFSIEDQELLSYLLEDEELDSKTYQPIPRRERFDKAPLSSGQQRLWFLDQLLAGLPVYNNIVGSTTQGKLHVETLERALREIVRRHESLRTTFAMDGTQPAQFVHETSSIDLSLIDLTHLPQDEREQEAQRLFTAETLRPFNLATGPLLRPTLLRLRDEDHIALLVMHHIISDAWSMNLMLNELTILYETFCAGRDIASAGFADSICRLRCMAKGVATGKRFNSSRLAYWREHLAGMTKILELPTDRPRPPVQSFRGKRQDLNLSPSLLVELKALSLHHGSDLVHDATGGLSNLARTLHATD